MKKIVLIVSALSLASLSHAEGGCSGGCGGDKKPADSTTQPTTDKTPSTPPKA